MKASRRVPFGPSAFAFDSAALRLALALGAGAAGAATGAASSGLSSSAAAGTINRLDLQALTLSLTYADFRHGSEC